MPVSGEKVKSGGRVMGDEADDDLVGEIGDGLRVPVHPMGEVGGDFEKALTEAEAGDAGFVERFATEFHRVLVDRAELGDVGCGPGDVCGLIDAAGDEFAIDPEAEAAAAAGFADVVAIEALAVVLVIAEFLGEGLVIPFVEDRVGDALAPDIDAAVLGAVGAVGAEGDLVVFPSEVVAPLGDEAGVGARCFRLGGEDFIGGGVECGRGGFGFGSEGAYDFGSG